MEKPESCLTCNRYTIRGQEQFALQCRAKPLSGIDLTQPLSKLVEGLRSDIVAVRSKLNDIGMGFTGWRERLVSVEGLLTCGLMALHHTMEEMREHETRYPKNPDDTKPRQMYADYTANHPEIHCNRFPAWSELSEQERGSWRIKSAALR